MAEVTDTKGPNGKLDFKEPPSEDFVNAVTTGGGCVRDCDYCGRTCFEDDESSYDWEPGELEGLRQRNKEDPNACASMDTVRTGVLAGIDFVTNCQCNGLRPYEDFIWGYRRTISDYIRKRTEGNLQDALSDDAMAEFLDENVAAIDAADQGKDFKKCKHCGGYFIESTMSEREYCQRCEQLVPKPPKMVDCPNCGATVQETELKGGARCYCVNCYDDDDIPF